MPRTWIGFNFVEKNANLLQQFEINWRSWKASKCPDVDFIPKVVRVANYAVQNATLHFKLVILTV